MAEILAPCGSAQALEAALRSGADAVYLGGEMFSARQNAANFSYDELKSAVYECHKRNVGVYLAINTLVTDEQINDCLNAVKTACELGIDGLITQDLVLVEVVRKCCPEMPIHSSTQMTVHTKHGALQAKELGFSRVVLSRELPYEIIEDIAKLPIETEVFVHGALCMSVSGQCFMSAIIGSRSANRGLCAQPCRLPMTAIKGRDEYALSLKDMCEIEYVDRFEKAGVDSLKIEGRMKRPEYVAAAVTAYKQAQRGERFDISLLEGVFSRSGFTDGYIAGKTGSGMFGHRRKEDVEAAAKALPKIHEFYRHEYKRSIITLNCRVVAGEPISVTATDENGLSVTAVGDVPQTANNRPCDEQLLTKQFSKLGDTIYTLGSLTAEIDDGLAVSAGQLNAIRRELTAKLDDLRAEHFTYIVEFDGTKLVDDFTQKTLAVKPKMRISISSAEQLDGVDISDIELVDVSLDMADELLKKGFDSGRLSVKMPRFTFDENADIKQLKELTELGIRHITCTNIAHIHIGRELGLTMHTDFGLNVTNSIALRILGEMGVSDAICSFELKAAQINRLSPYIPKGAIVYGRFANMLTVNCPIKKSVGCGKCTGKLFDRTGREFPVRCSKKQGYVELLNSEVLYMADKLSDLSVDFIRLDFYKESAAEVKDIINRYKNGEKPDINKLTRGLYYRGVR